MKNCKTTILKRAFMLASIIGAYSLGGTYSFAGNENGGGGNGTPAIPIRASELKPYIEKSRQYTEMAYYSFMRSSFAQTDMAMKILANRFEAAGEQNIVRILRTVELEVLEKGACIDPVTNKKTDSAAFPKQNKICFSAQRLASRKYTSANALDRLVPLFLHEVTHFVGASEHEAKTLQDQYVDFKIGNGITIDQQVIMAYGHLYTVESYLRMLQARPAGADIAEVCLHIGGMQTEIFQAKQSFVMQWGLQISSPRTEPIAYAMQSLSNAMQGYCLLSDRSDYDARYAQPPQGFLDGTGIFIPYVGHNDNINFAQSIQNALDTVYQLRSELDKSPSKIKCKFDGNDTDNAFDCTPNN